MVQIFKKRTWFCLFSILLISAFGSTEQSKDRENLTEAIVSHDLNQVKNIIESLKVSIDELGMVSTTPLMEAAQSGDLETVNYLLLKGANVNFQNDFQATPLSSALERSKNKQLTPMIVKILIEKGAHVSFSTTWKESPLMIVCEKWGVDCVKEFIKTGVDLETQTTSGKTALMFAVKNKNTDVLDLLINQYHVNLETKDYLGKTALFYAIDHESFLSTQFLIKAGANVNAEDLEGTTPFMVACSKGFPSLSQLLIDKTQDIAKINNKNQSALFFVAKSNDLKTAKLLMNKGLDINLKDDFGQTPIFNAIQNDRLLMFDLLIEKGADGSLQDAQGKSLAYIASEKNNLLAIRKLLGKNLPLDLPGPGGFTPLMNAILKGNFEMVKFLFDHGANPLAKTTQEITIELFENGGFLHIPGFGKKILIPNGSTAIDLADKLKETQIASLLSKKK